MKETREGKLVPETKEEARHTIREIFKDRDKFRIKDLTSLGYSEQTIYHFWDSCTEMKEELDIGRTEYTCSICGKEYENRGSLITHEVNCSQDKVDSEEWAEEEINRFDLPEYMYSVYTLRIVDGDGQVWWYIGQTKSLKRRLGKHYNENIDSKQVGGFIEEVEVMSVVDIEQFKCKEDALRREREKAFETAIEKDTTNIFGGM